MNADGAWTVGIAFFTVEWAIRNANSEWLKVFFFSIESYIVNQAELWCILKGLELA